MPTTTLKGRKDFPKSFFPPTLSKNLDLRVEVLDEAKTNIELQSILYNQCRDDVVFFINWFCWTFNPKVEPNHFPFVLYPVQRKLALSYLEEIETGKGSLTEKSREVGATYIALAVYLHQWLFADGFEALLLSYRENEVDNPTPSSLFGKLRYMINRLPFWLRPFNLTSKHVDKFLNLINPDNGNSIVGMTTTPDAGRSGRKKAVLIDEYASINQRIVRGLEAGLNETTNCIQRISTPKGINQFKAVRDRGLCRVHTIHWTQIPTKREGLYYIDPNGKRVDLDTIKFKRINKYGFLVAPNGRATKIRIRSKWYDAKCKEYLYERDRAQELDINYLGSGFCRFDVNMIEERSTGVRDGIRGMLINEGTEEDPKPKFVQVDEGAPFEIEVWKYPTKPYYHGRTVVAADVAEGLEKGDFNSADILEKDPVTLKTHLVAHIHGHFTPDVWAEKLVLVGLWYDGGAELAVERNKDGLGVLLDIRNRFNYSNIFKAKDDGRDGFLTKQGNKFTITGDLDAALRDEDLVVESINHYTELSMFENNNGKLGATGQNHDDRVMSLSIGWHVIREYGRPKQVQPATTERKKTKRFDVSRY